MENDAHYTVSCLTLSLRAHSQTLLPPYAGSTLRGGVGWALREVSPDVYRALYAPTAPHGHRMANQEHAPQPLVLIPPLPPVSYAEIPPHAWRVQRGERFHCGIGLIGTHQDCIAYLPFIIRAFEVLGENRGLGKGRHRGLGQFSIDEVQEGQYRNGWGQRLYSARLGSYYKDPRGISFTEIRQLAQQWEPIEEVGLQFLTPTKLIFQGKPLAPSQLTFSLLMRNLLRRSSLLGELYGGTHTEPAYFQMLLKQAAEVQVMYNHLAWHAWQRYSSTQNTTVDMSGMVGEIAFRGKLDLFLSFLLWGELIHLGKGVTTGMGKYTLVF
jgi:hypothetical protein